MTNAEFTVLKSFPAYLAVVAVLLCAGVWTGIGVCKLMDLLEARAGWRVFKKTKVHNWESMSPEEREAVDLVFKAGNDYMDQVSKAMDKMKWR